MSESLNKNENPFADKSVFDAAVKRWNDDLDSIGTIPLWKDEVPLYDEKIDQRRPSLALLPPQEGKTRGMVLVCAGGAYLFKGIYEGKNIAEKIREAGLNAAVLDYRVIPYPIEAAVHDVLRAIRMIRYHAAEWNVLPDKIAVIGFSAGGHLTGMAATKFDYGNDMAADPIERCSSRPDAAIQCYGTISFSSFQTRNEELLGTGNDQKRKVELSPEKNLRPDSPPFFLWQTGEDTIIDPRQMLVMAKELTDHGIPYEMHLFPDGEHGLGLADGKSLVHPVPPYPHTAKWFDLCIGWLEGLGF